MERFSTCELRQKEIINVCNGSKMGCASDFEFNMSDGKITAIIVTKPSGFLGLGRGIDVFIPWDKIECFGEDTILVRLSSNDHYSPDLPRRKRKFW